MGHGNALVHLGALELKDVLRLAASHAHLIGPRADASLRIEHQARRTRDHIEHAIHTEVELVANAGLLVAKVSVLARTVQRGLGSLC